MKDVITLSGLQKTFQSSPNLEDFVNSSVCKFVNNEVVFRQFLYWHIYNKVEILICENDEIQRVEQSDLLEDLLPRSIRKSELREFQRKSDLIYPRPVMGTLSFALLIALLLIPILLLVYVVFIYPEALPVIFELMVFGGGLLLVFSLVILVHFIKPSLLASNDLPGIKNYDDLINKILNINEHFFRINDYQRTREELAILYMANDKKRSNN